MEAIQQLNKDINKLTFEFNGYNPSDINYLFFSCHPEEEEKNP